ncbi:hypothetical protein HN51_028352 [Arachis hypogaea]
MLPHFPSIAPQPSQPSFPSIATAAVRMSKPLSRRFPTSSPPPHSDTRIQRPTPKTQTLGYSPTAARVSLNAAVALRHHRVFVRSSAAPRFFLIQQLVGLPQAH